jgi:manganese-dependent ADP-ribose/CDP-alcohol diphosphatase
MKRRRFLAISTAAVTVARAESTAAPLLSFGLTTDVQYADADPQGERHFRESPAKLREAVADLAKEKLPFTLHLGDVIDRDFGSYEMILRLFKPLGHPVRHLLGNHDYSVKDDEKARVAALLEMPADYYAFTNGGVRFLMLDTNGLSTYKHPKQDAATSAAEGYMKKLAETKANNAKPWNGGVQAEQLAWIKKELTAADAAKTPVIVCGHHPLLPAEGHQVWNSDEVLATLRDHLCVRAYFCGHNHAGNEAVIDGIPCITFKSILHEPGITAYAVLRLYNNHLVIEGRGREKSRKIALR